MGMQRTKRWIAVETAIAKTLVAIVGPLYRFFFGWVDRRLARKQEQRLAADIKLSLRFLFTTEKGCIVPNEGVPFPPAFDYAFVTVRLDNLFIRFMRGREELRVSVSPVFAPSEWHDLSLVLGALSGESHIERYAFQNLWEVSRILEPQINALKELLTVDRFNTLEQRLREDVYIPEKNMMRVWEAEINWRLYGRNR
jgi:hypothetical protein